MVNELSAEYSVKQVCATLAMPRSTYYRAPVEKIGDPALREKIETVIMRWPFYGYRRVTQQLKREGVTVGETRIRRLLRQLEHSCHVGKVRISTTDSQHNFPRLPELNQET